MNIDIATITISPVERAYLTKSGQKQEQAQVKQESKPIPEHQQELWDQHWKAQPREVRLQAIAAALENVSRCRRGTTGHDQANAILERMLRLNRELGNDETIAACNLVREHEYAKERAAREMLQKERRLEEAQERRRFGWDYRDFTLDMEHIQLYGRPRRTTP